MKDRLGISVFFLLTALLALYIAPYYSSAGMQAFEDTSDVANSVYYILMILGFTAIVILLIKLRKDLLKPLFYLLILITYFYAFMPFIGVLSAIPSIILLYLLAKTRHWMVVNISALLIASAVTAIFGISLEPFPVIVLLTLLAAYDYIAVHKTKHMLTLADSVSEMKIPVVFIIPGKNRDAIMGVGDAVMPNILAVSAITFNSSPIQALLTVIFGYAGLLILLKMVETRKEAQPGLPILNASAILGFLLGFLFCH
ncbi:presenilin family intramembrane aspartyl protease PSH [Geoglobus acetivorans]|uniref:Signal-peptide peptidase, presenilin aspartyl protease n=1 Tax=Geoglobus acetivorans TaxID=565033 RepID=A0A0A7GF40_GEOAI|nr:hypothetical protein GACE_1615 [Geoglobus acetivorans]